MFFNNFEIETIMKITELNDHVHPDNSMQVCVDGLGIDCVGGVYRMSLDYTPLTVERRNKLLQDLKVGNILLANAAG